jgi:hypothetical protein
VQGTDADNEQTSDNPNRLGMFNLDDEMKSTDLPASDPIRRTEFKNSVIAPDKASDSKNIDESTISFDSRDENCDRNNLD